MLAPKGEAWPELPAGRLFRIVSEPLEGKGRQRYIGCGPEGRVGLALQEKHRTEKNERFFNLHRGDVSATDTEAEGRRARAGRPLRGERWWPTRARACRRRRKPAPPAEQPKPEDT